MGMPSSLLAPPSGANRNGTRPRRRSSEEPALARARESVSRGVRVASGTQPAGKLSQLSTSDAIDINEQVQRAAEQRVSPVRRRIDDQPGVLHATKKDFNRGVNLQPRELTAEADMDAGAPSETLFLLTFEIEFVRVAEHLRIAVRRAIHEEDRRPLWNGGPIDVDVGESGPGGPKVDRRLEAQHLFNSAWNQLRPAAQQVDGPGVAQEGEHAMGDEVDCGVMTGDEYKDAIVYDLAGGHASIGAVVVHQL